MTTPSGSPYAEISNMDVAVDSVILGCTNDRLLRGKSKRLDTRQGPDFEHFYPALCAQRKYCLRCKANSWYCCRSRPHHGSAVRDRKRTKQHLQQAHVPLEYLCGFR